MFIEKPASKASLALRGKVHGVGTNDANYMINYVDEHGKQHMCPFYSMWKNMLQRCYNVKFQANRPEYEKCSVHPKWHSFSVFRAWVETQDWIGKELDKDIRFVGNTEYSEEACLFVTPYINTLLVGSHRVRAGEYAGIFQRGPNRFEASIKLNKAVAIGTYPTKDLAFAAYCNKKASILKECASEQTCQLTIEGLLKHAEFYMGVAVALLHKDK